MLTVSPWIWIECNYPMKGYKYKKILVDMTTTQTSIFTMNVYAEFQSKRLLVFQRVFFFIAKKPLCEKRETNC